MAVPYSAAFLVPMGLLHVVLFMVMTSSSVALPAEEFRSAAVVNACDRRDATSTDHQQDSSSLTRKDKDDQTWSLVIALGKFRTRESSKLDPQMIS